MRQDDRQDDPPREVMQVEYGPERWREVVHRKQAAKQALLRWKLDPELVKRVDEGGLKDVTGIPRSCGILGESELEITESNATSLIERLAKGELRSVEVATAFCKRASIAQQLVNCLSEIMFDEALERAVWLDAELKRTGKPVGPLHGLPISIKDVFPVKGYDTAVGFVAWAEDPSKENAVLVDSLLRLGAVLYVKTAVPPGLLAFHTLSNLNGITLNPHNRLLTPGGSSGGEAALLALRGSPLGIGTDSGGSVRCPAAQCGLYGFKPTAGRLSVDGYRVPYAGNESNKDTAGFLAHSIEDAELVFRAMTSDDVARVDDPELLPVPLSEVTAPAILSFAVLMDDLVACPDPSITRTLTMTVTALKAAGHSVIPWPHMRDDWAASASETVQTIWHDQWRSLRRTFAASGEPIVPCVFVGEGDMSVGKTNEEIWRAQEEMRRLRKAFSALWDSTRELTGTGRPVDILICPHAVLSHEKHYKQLGYDNYTWVFNAVDYPAMTVPVTTVDPNLDDTWYADTPHSQDERTARDFYDPGVSAGCPVAVQIIARRGCDEMLLQAGKKVVAALKPMIKA